MNWKKVEDELPKTELPLLLHGKGGRSVTGYYRDGEFISLDYWHEDFEKCEEITHWCLIIKPI